MSIESVAHRLIQLCREGKFSQAQEELYAPNARSVEIEAMSTGPLGNANGLAAIREKTRQFENSVIEIHSLTVSEPLFAAPYFTLTMSFDATYKELGRRAVNEICVYQVVSDKIVSEQFFYEALM